MGNLATFLKEYRNLVREGEKTLVERMYLLVEYKELTAVWQTGPYTTWHSLLRHERLCPTAYFEHFEKATEFLSRSEITRLGADATVVLAKVEKHLRDATREKIDAYIDEYRVAPPRYVIWAWVRTLRQRPVQEFVSRVQPPPAKIRSISRSRH